jgi:hypothetical protein
VTIVTPLRGSLFAGSVFRRRGLADGHAWRGGLPHQGDLVRSYPSLSHRPTSRRVIILGSLQKKGLHDTAKFGKLYIRNPRLEKQRTAK